MAGWSDFAWAFWDFMPTVAEIVGFTADLPAEIDGISILPTILGQQQTPKEYLFWTWPGGGSLEKFPMEGLEREGPQTGFASSPGGAPAISGYSVRAGDWKGVVQHCASDLKPAQNDATSMELYAFPFSAMRLFFGSFSRT